MSAPYLDFSFHSDDELLTIEHRTRLTLSLDLKMDAAFSAHTRLVYNAVLSELARRGITNLLV